MTAEAGRGRDKPEVPAGLCESCVHARTVESRRGSRFVLCRRSREDPRYPRYPRLPVVGCPGYEAAGERGPPADPDEKGGGEAPK